MKWRYDYLCTCYRGFGWSGKSAWWIVIIGRWIVFLLNVLRRSDYLWSSFHYSKIPFSYIHKRLFAKDGICCLTKQHWLLFKNSCGVSAYGSVGWILLQTHPKTSPQKEFLVQRGETCRHIAFTHAGCTVTALHPALTIKNISSQRNRGTLKISA